MEKATDSSARQEGRITSAHASGKVILFGEHAVVHGTGAIAAGMSRGITAQAKSSESDELWVGQNRIPDGHELMTALFLMREKLACPPARINIQPEIPLGAGLGSSAGMAVAAARSLSELYGLNMTEHSLFLAAQKWESVFHGTPSGVDVAAAQSDSVIFFSRGEEPQPLILDRPLRLVIVQAGPPASTKEMVASVARHKARNPETFEKTLEAIASLVQNAVLILRQGDQAALGKLMDLNHMLLAGWMLSTEDIETSCYAARKAGALGAKLTGAGGGGCIVALCPDTETQSAVLQNALDSKKIAFSTNVGGTNGCKHDHAH